MLAPCSACGRPVAKDAPACPGCGKLTAHGTDKKTVANVFAVVFIIFLGVVLWWSWR